MQAKLALSYTGFVMLACVLLLVVVSAFLLRYVPDGPIDTRGPFVPNRSDLIEAFVPRALQAMAGMLVLGLVGGWLLAGRMLSPLRQITHAARRASAGSLTHRIDLEGRQDELRELADAFDTMLAQLEAHVAEQQRFAANASHELRTPLATTQTLLEVARDDPDHGGAELVDRLLHMNTRAIDLTEALLLLSRADRRSFSPEPVDLSLLAEEAAETLLPLAERRRVAIDVTGDVAPTSGSRALLLHLITKLVHNAIVHNSGAPATVSVRTVREPGWVVLTVENTGTLLDPHVVTGLTERFRRGSGRVRSDHD
ncbi:sensor histidine kinase, partial [Pseudactinotalea sp.]|uniref:sensor histidine kinase n=1 Tax=Pseudactinotalea sp. TaxID=1926260 RepID=UPI003B3B3400